jgi:fucose 4-O-acetylase-like acetyltransferase
MEKKSNKQFMIFSAITMICVVDAHAWVSMNLMSRYLTYNMFIMPAFIFISGYFCVFDKDDSLLKYIKKKVKKLLLPYYIWWFLYALFVLILNKAFFISIGGKVTWINLIFGPWISGECWSFNSPSWFVCCLFLVQILYCFLRKVLKNHWNDVIVFFVLTILTVLVTDYVTNNEINHNYCNVYRVLLLEWFYHFGVIFRNYIERWFEKISATIFCVFCIIVLAFLSQTFYTTDFRFNTLKWSSDNMGIFGIGSGIYLITVGTIGIAFWLKISQVLVPALENSTVVNFISNHTFEIMINHIVFMWLFNLLLVKINGFKSLINFDINEAICRPWYRWLDSKWSNLMYFICGMAGAMLVAFFTDKFKDKWKGTLFFQKSLKKK